MYTLFIDTHSSEIVIIIYKDKKIIAKKEEKCIGNHSIATMPILIEAMNEQNLQPKDLSEIIVVNGPGSFTGVRIGVTIAKTLAYTLKIPIKTMSSILIKAVSLDHNKNYIVEREKNGVFIGKFDKENNLIEDYKYISNKDYKEINDKDNYIEDILVDYEKIIKYATNIKETNPHAVNPLYVKKIEVQK